MSKFSCGFTLDGGKFIINNDTADEPFITITFHEPKCFPRQLKQDAAEAFIESLASYDIDLDEMEW